MLREINNVKQKVRGQFRRWFTDEDMDLYVWFTSHVPVGFQLSYDKQQSERSICWDSDDGFQLYSVDTGETEPLHYKMSPIYLTDDDFDSFKVARRFLMNSEYIEASLADFIYARLLEYPQHNGKHQGRGSVSDIL